MRHFGGLAFFLALLCIGAATLAQSLEQDLCSYTQPESRLSALVVQGSFSWYDGPYSDNRNRTISASSIAEYSGLHSTASLGQELDARLEVRGTETGWALDLSGSGDLKSFAAGDSFVIGAFGIDASLDSGLEMDLTGGIGQGRFHDVAPLAKAIRIQNALLDLGVLLAPIGDPALGRIAQILGEIGPPGEEKILDITEQLSSTELLKDGGLGVLGLLAIEDVISSEESRLCGGDIQARIGASAKFFPAFRVSATGIVLLQRAVTPDPVSQVNAGAEAKVRLAHPEQFRIAADVSYSRRLPDGWTARASYRLQIDRMWSTATETLVSHAASASVTTKLFDSIGLNLVGLVQHETGDEEITISLAAYVEVDVL
ncbi:hypothetical protein JW848_04410 [Candidatus Bipolaricaulota bacterium]|nr:hypothetical protein [Candidatus Bipolaricaulota bacterium]